jgi:AraC family transcriptional regulator of adaptative response / DNA-3-methyladenine glycosylase II
MTFDPDAAYQAILARDARFDGRLFVGVTSTGIYCRPICRVRTPMKKNCRFFATAAQAEAATFRPCMKCRPEIAPGPGLPWTVMDASRTLARQAALGLDAQAADGEAPGIAALAERLGVSERHLRRIFFEEHGVTPLQYLQTRRLHLAKQLLTDTRLPVAQVALTSGFRSLRRFNAAFADSYRMNPARLRKAAAEPDARRADPAPSVTVALAHRLPYDTTALLRFVAQRAIPGVESVDGLSIRRSVRAGTLGAEAGWIAATFLPEAARVRLEFAPALTPASGRIVAAVRRWLDLDAAPDSIDAALAELPGAPGLRLPGSIDGFELAVRAVLGQQVTVAAARTLARRLVATFGSPLATPWPDIDRTFPAPETLAALEPARIAELGIIGARAQAIVALARAWPEIASALQPRSEPDVLIERLCRLPGIGPWTAHYVAMRVLGWPDAFPPNDVAVLKAMRQLFGTASPRDALARAQTWQPWRSYAVLRLWNTLGAST